MNIKKILLFYSEEDFNKINEMKVESKKNWNDFIYDKVISEVKD